mmetsp:Transcript_39555/g.88000  ORF Transcript_39555/g.88000 Transcript_39555/m.88000 type:complete len:85 (-) Transcript_39555:2630-2884(-)
MCITSTKQTWNSMAEEHDPLERQHSGSHVSKHHLTAGAPTLLMVHTAWGESTTSSSSPDYAHYNAHVYCFDHFYVSLTSSCPGA